MRGEFIKVSIHSNINFIQTVPVRVSDTHRFCFLLTSTLADFYKINYELENNYMSKAACWN